jgi:hypothetical protein
VANLTPWIRHFSPFIEFKCDEFGKFGSPDSPLTEYKSDEFDKIGPPDSPSLGGLTPQCGLPGGYTGATP